MLMAAMSVFHQCAFLLLWNFSMSLCSSREACWQQKNVNQLVSVSKTKALGSVRESPGALDSNAFYFSPELILFQKLLKTQTSFSKPKTFAIMMDHREMFCIPVCSFSWANAALECLGGLPSNACGPVLNLAEVCPARREHTTGSCRAINHAAALQTFSYVIFNFLF